MVAEKHTWLAFTGLLAQQDGHEPVSYSTDRQMLLDLQWRSPDSSTENVDYHQSKHLVGPGEMAQTSSLGLMSQNSHFKTLNI